MQRKAEKSEKIKLMEIQLNKLPCENEILGLFWKNISEDDFAFVTEDELAAIKDCTSFIEFKEIDLNGDGLDEMIVSGREFPFCASGGCQQTIFQKNKDSKYHIIYDEIGSFQVTKDKTPNGYKKLEYVFRDSSSEFTRIIFVFTGNKYVRKHCQVEHLEYLDKNGKLVFSEKPRITPFKCKNSSN